MTTKDRNRTRLPKDTQAYEGLAAVAQALANPLRLELVESLAQSPRSVDALSSLCALPVKTVSHHLRILRTAGLVRRMARGREAIYSLADVEVARLWVRLRTLAEKQGRLRVSPAQTPGLTTAELEELLHETTPTILDVRPKEEFEAGHIPGALSIPLDELDSRIEEVPRDQPVIAVCRGPHCRMAEWAVGVLRERSFDARRYESGMVEWLADGHEMKQQSG
jgi:rhodanese-related sulfurtransferase